MEDYIIPLVPDFIFQLINIHMISNNGIELIKQFEGYRANAYLDSAGVPTIGYGTIRYADGSKVKLGDKTDKETATKLLTDDVNRRAAAIRGLLRRPMTQNQFDALVSFAYNLGMGALEKSTLLKKVNMNPDDPAIRDEFMKWNKARVKGVLTELPGLTSRRKKEADLYFL